MLPEKIRVLIVDDDNEDFELIRICLEEPDSMGLRFELERAASLEGGLRLLELSRFDAILLDLMLPDSQGIETASQMLAKAGETPVIVMTGLGAEEVAFEAMRLGAQDYLVKSTSDSRLLKRSIWYAIERRKVLEQSESIIRRAADGMVVVDAFGVIRYVNPAAELLFGLKADDMLGHPFPRPIKAGEAGLLKIPGTAVENGTAEVRVTEIDWKGRPALLASIRDITELQKLEQLKAEIKERRKMDQLKDELVATVSHELRTPLTIVKGAVDNLSEGVAGALSGKQREVITLATRNLGRLARMINNLLDLSRLESGHAQVKRSALDLASVIAELAAAFHEQAAAKGIAIEKHVEPHLPEVFADPEMIMEVLLNLVENGLRYARAKVEVRATTVGRTAAGTKPSPQAAAAELVPWVLVEIRDDGRGIPPDRLGDLFNKFVQVNRVRAEPGYKGTGLGLAICKEILTLHGSKIWAENLSEGGACFSFLLPAWVGQEGRPPAPEGAAAGGERRR
jgi:signal transduction histidine kinase